LPVNPVIWVLGAWYGVLPFLIFSRGKLLPRTVRAFDIDAQAVSIADKFNNRWEIENWQFKAFQADCSTLHYTSGEFGPAPDIVINTSVEHFESWEWWKNIPTGTTIALQATNMEHDEHIQKITHLGDLKAALGELTKIDFEGALPFRYPGFSFDRFMIIGAK
jgi:hypothetical protein